jgi:hypothetical protein
VLFFFRAGNFIEMYSAKAVSATENNYCVKIRPIVSDCTKIFI